MIHQKKLQFYLLVRSTRPFQYFLLTFLAILQCEKVNKVYTRISWFFHYPYTLFKIKFGKLPTLSIYSHTQKYLYFQEILTKLSKFFFISLIFIYKYLLFIHKLFTQNFSIKLLTLTPTYSFPSFLKRTKTVPLDTHFYSRFINILPK